ncbi:MAG: peptide deformylase [Spirochaetales bacterium]
MKVLTLGEDILRQKAVDVEEINDEIRELIGNMFTTLYAENGIGLAAPQIGKSLRLFIIELDDEIKRVFINPQITATSQETSLYEEGCLSVPGVYNQVERPVAVTVQASDENAKKFTLEADGLLARAIQHEYDHLEGILYIDRTDADFKQKTIEIFARRAERRQKREAEKKRKAAKIAAKKHITEKMPEE